MTGYPQVVYVHWRGEGMMKSGLELRSDVVEDFARSCRRTVGSSSSCIETLEKIATLAAPRIDDLFLTALREPDEITVQFLDLIDQIVFECSEQSHAQPSVKEYIAEHLANRLFIYLDAICNPETYAVNCKKRDLTPDDAVIIRARRMEECIPLLVEEFHAQPQMQSHILRALLAFDADDLLNLYYEAARSQSIVVASLALIGLKKCGHRFRFWKNLSREGEDYGSLYEYARSFDCAALGRNPLPVDPPSLLFVLQFLDLGAAIMSDPDAFKWAMNAMRAAMHIGESVPFYREVEALVPRIIVYAPLEIIRGVLRSKEDTILFARLIDSLPRECFHQVSIRLSILGEDFLRRMSALVEDGTLMLDSANSNMMNFLIWRNGGAL